MKNFMEYSAGNSVIHRLDPRTKLLLPFMICIGSFSTGNLITLLAFLVCVILLGIIGNHAKGTLRTFYTLLKISIFIFVVQLLFVRSGETILQLPLGIKITDDGLHTAASVVLKLICATLALSVMLSLTKMNDLSNSLVAKWRLPYKYAFAVTTTIRFIPSFSNDMQDIMEAQTARGVEFDTRNIFKKIKLMLPLCVPMLVSSVKSIDSAAMAAELRGFNLRNRNSCYRVSEFKIIDLLFLIIGAAFIAAGIIF